MLYVNRSSKEQIIQNAVDQLYSGFPDPKKPLDEHYKIIECAFECAFECAYSKIYHQNKCFEIALRKIEKMPWPSSQSPYAKIERKALEEG